MGADRVGGPCKSIAKAITTNETTDLATEPRGNPSRSSRSLERTCSERRCGIPWENGSKNRRVASKPKALGGKLPTSVVCLRFTPSGPEP